MVGISDFYKDRTLLITGATGFLGKALVEKVLRSVPDVKKIILLIRGKPLPDGGWMAAKERAEREIFRAPLFTTLRRRLQDRFLPFIEEKIEIVEGDLSQEDLGLDRVESERIARETDIFINSAAVVAFDERLDRALDLNVLAVRRLLQLVRRSQEARRRLSMPRPLLVHISTCYVCGNRSGVVAEEAPDPTGIKEQLTQFLQICKDIEASLNDDDTPSVIRETSFRERAVEEGMRLARSFGFNDTYTFTKWLGERLLVAERGTVPTVIVRPAIIESTLKEPEGGWIENQRMADPLIVGFAKGLLRDFPGDPESVVDIIPCDLVVNALLAITADFGSRMNGDRLASGSPCEVYQIATSTTNLLTLGEMVDYCSEYFIKSPLIDRDGRPIRVRPWTLPSRKKFQKRLDRKKKILQWLERLGKRIGFLPMSRRWLYRLSTVKSALNRLEHYVAIYAPYTHFYARFSTKRTEQVWERMDEREREQFPFDPRSIDWVRYLQEVHIPGLKRHILGIASAGADGEELETLPDLLARAAARFPNKVALQVKRNGRWIRWTYQQWHRQAIAGAWRLIREGVRSGDRVLLWAPNGPGWAIAYFSVSFAGATVVPVDWQWSADEAAEIARISSAIIGLCDDSREEVLTLSLKRRGVATKPLSLSSLLTETETEGVRGLVRQPVSGDDIASVIFVTGPSVEPKGACLTHSNFLSNLRSIVTVLPPMQNDQFLSLLPLHHALEFTGGLLVPMWGGATVTYPESLRSRTVQELMQEVGITVVIGVPRVFQIFYEGIENELKKRGRFALWGFAALKFLSRLIHRLTGRNPGRSLFRAVHQRFGGRIRAFISGGAALPPHIFDAFQAMGFLICEGYGLTETSPVVTVNPMDAPKRGSVGRPLPGVDVVLRDPDEDGVGEVLVKGPNVFLGYLGNPEATERVLRDGWLYTGDLGRTDRDGYLYITGRIKDVIITGAGKNVYPDEIEARLAGLPLVLELCVVGMWDDETMGERVHLVVRPDPSAVGQLPEEEWRKEIRTEVQRRSAHWPSYQRIAQIHFWNEELPKGIALSPDRVQVKGRLLMELKGVVAREQPRKETPSPFPQDLLGQISRLIAQITRKPERPVTPATPLDEVGLDSLLRLELLVGLENLFNVSLPESVVTQARTAGEIAEVIMERLGSRPSVISYDGASPPDLRSRLEAIDEEELMRWTQETKTVRFLRQATVRLLTGFYHRFLNLQVAGQNHIPSDRPFIIAANHCSHLDTGAILVALGEKGSSLFVLGAQDYFFNNRLKGWFFKTFLKVVPFSRYSSPLESLRIAGGLLRSGSSVLIFPEGTRSVTGKLQPFKPGLALLAVETSVPIIPARIDGTFEALPKGRRLPRRATVRVTFTRPIIPPDCKAEDDRQQIYRYLTEAVRRQIENPISA